MATVVEKAIHRHFLEKDFWFKTSIDAYLKWIPFATVFVCDLLGVRTRSPWKKQVLITGATEAIRYFITDNLKSLTHEHRPFPYFGTRSFPSGHTCSSFAGGQFMHRELKDSLPILSLAGYAAGTTVAVIRLMKSRHWMKDVIGGAVIGILSAKLARLAVDKLSERARNRNRKRVEFDTQFSDPPSPA